MNTQIPAPKRGEIVRQIGDELRKYREPLGKLVFAFHDSYKKFAFHN
jgi:hypothetical protein